MTYKIKKMINNGTEYKVGSIDSSNDTYKNIVHLTQAQYDALENPDPNTLYSTPESETPGSFSPENEGTVGQVLTRTITGYDWENINSVPSTGTTGQVLTKTADGYAFQDIGLSVSIMNSINRMFANNPLSQGTNIGSIAIPEGANIFVFGVWSSYVDSTTGYEFRIIPLNIAKSYKLFSHSDEDTTYSVAAHYNSSNDTIVIKRYQDYSSVKWMFF